MELKIEYLPIKALKPYEKNTRKHQKKDVDNISKSIEKYGMCDAIGIWGDENIIVEGHGRMLACKQLGMTEVPCVRLDHLTDEQRREYAIAHNATAELSEWDLDILPDELAELDLSDFDFDFGIEDEEKETEIVEDEAPEVDEDAEPIAKLGDIWQLGRHRLMCGDSTSITYVEKLMNGEKADMVFTDPPYNIQTEGGCKGEVGKALKKQGKDIEFIADFEPKEFLNVLPCVFNKNMNAYIFCNKELLPSYLNWAVENRYSYNVLVWKKPNAIPIGDSHRPDIEYMLLFRKNAIWNNGLKNVNYSRCLEVSRETGLHPTMKPISLITNEMQISSNKHSNVVDFFGGSGSTLIACEQLNRTCYMMELDPKYCDVIIKRWETLTGEKAVLIND
jgi:site-specific DNA-methyltransferase (adenine-specific)